MSAPKPAPLYLLPAPIGDRLEDLSVAAVKLLQTAQHIVFEEPGVYVDRLRARGMLRPDHAAVYLSDPSACAAAQAWLEAGHPVVLTASSGIPGLVDPGWALVDWALRQGPAHVRLEPVGVSSALDAALCVAGVDLHAFYFAGHMPDCLRWPAAVDTLGHPIVVYVRGEALPQLGARLDALGRRWRLLLAADVRKRTPGEIVRHEAPLGWAAHPALAPRPGASLVAIALPPSGPDA